MKLIYNEFDLSSIGEVTVKWNRDYEGGEAPQRCRVTVKASVKVFQRCYADNYALLRQAQSALLQPNQQLTWTNDDTGENYIDQTGNCVAANFPEEWGTYFQQLDLTFSYYENLDVSGQNLLCSFVKTGSSVTLVFNNILKWSESASTKRFSSFRSLREEVRGLLTVEGLLLGDTTLPLAERRASLAQLVAKFRRELNSADGLLTYGSNLDGAQSMFNGLVRITSFEADVDQSICAVPFKFTADYTLFPDEKNYATVTATAEVKDPQTGELTLQVTGKIEASTEALARTKLATVIATFLKNYAFDKGQQLELDTSANLISANADGDAFTELSFSGQWRKWRASNQGATFQKTGSKSQPVTLGNVTTWDEGYKAERFDAMRSHRRNATETISAAGTLAGDATMNLTDRRAALLKMQRALTAEVNAADGTLVFGDWSKVVRVESFEAKINQAETGIDWTLAANYILFPADNYATVEATAEERDPQTGELFLNVTGKIQAASEAVARAKLTGVLAGFIKTYGYTKGQQLDLTTTPNLISANADGDTFTELTFSAQYRRWRASNQLATFLKTGNPGQPLSLGNVATWNEGYKAERFDAMRSHRRNATETISAAGTLAGDATMNLTDRRAALLKMQRALTAEVNAADGTLVFGDWSKVVRVESFEAKINQAETGIDWTLAANYVLFPADNYATVEATAEERDPLTGELTLHVTGKIQSVTEAVARTKLTAVLTGFVATYGYAKGQQLDLTTTPNLISANGDGDTFTELSFSATYRRWRAGNFTATLLVAPATEPLSLGQVSTWEEGVKSERFDPLRPQRRRTLDTITATGVLVGDAALSLPDRKVQLLARQRAMTAACNSAQGVLNYADWSKTVRVESFNAKINQAETGIEWTLTAYYNAFPDETSYTTVEASAEEKDGMTGETFLTCSGKIQAATEAAARTKLAAVVTTFLKQYGYDKGQQLELNTTPNLISANADGDTFTELSFSGQWRKWRASNQRAAFTKTGNKSPVALGNVRTWDDGYRAERFDVHRSERRHATGMVSATGTFSVDPSMAIADRRAALLKQQRALKAEVNGADGTLTYGDWTQVVRVEEFNAKINQAETGVDWSFSASYSLFPNEGGYVTCEFSADQKDEVESGDQFLTFAGEIYAPNGALARAKLASLRTATLGIYGFTATQRVRGGSSSHEVSANGDATAGVPEGIETQGDAAGVSFIHLSFSEEYRRRTPGTVVSSKYTIASRDDTTSGLVLTTYAGTVTATGVTADAALAAAAVRALILGANKEGAIDSTAFLKSQQWTIERRQLTTDNAEEFVSLSFSYEYQSKLAAGRSYAEVNTATNTDAFGTDSQSVTGSIIARDEATATAIYQQSVRAPYAAQLIRNETTTFSRVLAEPSVETGMIFTGVQNPQAPSSFKTQMLRLEFNFTVHSVKPAGRMASRYSMAVSRDFLNLKLTTHVRGAVFAATRAAADALLTTLFGKLTVGQLTASERGEDHDYTPELDAFTKLDFDDCYEDRLTGVTGLLECHVTESVKYSSTRWAVQPLPFDSNGGGGVSIIQPAGVQEGSRTVRGTVTAATLADAQAWAWKQQALLTGDADGTKAPLPPELENDFEFAPRVNGVTNGTGQNVRLFRVSFTFGELLANYPKPS